MKPSRHYGVCALSGWLHGTQLRLKVMAGVVAVTLVALAGFDFAAVSIMRHYLFGQTDKNLQTALTVTRGQLPALLPGAHRPSVAGPMRQRAILGDFDITY